MSFLFGFLRVDREVIQETLFFPGNGGLQLAFTRFAGYSPVLNGSINTRVADSAGSTSSEKSSDIIVTITVRASDLMYKSNIHIQRLDNSLTLSTGGLSIGSYLTFPRLTIDITIFLPATIGHLSLISPTLPVHVHSISNAGDVVIRSSFSRISVSAVRARSLTVSSLSGDIIFECDSEQSVDNAINISNSSGSVKLSSTMTTSQVKVQNSSGSVQLSVMTTANDVAIYNSSGGITGQVHYKTEGSFSRYENNSGRIDLKLKSWSGFLIAENSSGGYHVEGLEKWDGGWRRGSGEARAVFVTQSGGIHIGAL